MACAILNLELSAQFRICPKRVSVFNGVATLSSDGSVDYTIHTNGDTIELAIGGWPTTEGLNSTEGTMYDRPTEYSRSKLSHTKLQSSFVLSQTG